MDLPSTPPPAAEVPPKPKGWGGPRALLRALLQLDDTPHSIALGSAIGMWVALTPTVGIQMAMVMVFAFLTAPFFRWNRVAGLLMVYVSNPLTMIPIFWLSYKVGTLFVGGSLTYEELKSLVTPLADRSASEHFRQLWIDLGWPIMVGSFVVCTVSALLTYPAILWLVNAYRRKPLP